MSNMSVGGAAVKYIDPTELDHIDLGGEKPAKLRRLRRLTHPASVHQGPTEVEYGETPDASVRRIAAVFAKRNRGSFFFNVPKKVPVSLTDGGLVESSLASLYAVLQAHIVMRVVTATGKVRFYPVQQKHTGWIRERAREFFPHIRSLRRSAYLASDGTIVRDPGPDPRDGILLTGCAPRELSLMDAKLVIEKLLTGFKFASINDMLGAIALLVTPILRPAISGPTPLFGIHASGVRAGKTYLGDIAGVVATGGTPKYLGLPQNRVETPYTLCASLDVSSQFMFCDNVADDAIFESSDMERVITARGPTYLRPARSGSLKPFDNRDVTFVYTANRISLTGGMARRVVPIGLQQHPVRHRYAHPKLHEWVRKHHPTAVGAILAVVEEWIARGRPTPDGVYLSFPEWSALAGGVVAVAAELLGIGDMDSVNIWMADLGSRVPAEELEMETLLAHLAERGGWFRVKADIVPLLHDLGLKALRAKHWSDTSHGKSVRLGCWLKEVASSGRAFGSFSLMKKGSKSDGYVYAAEPVSDVDGDRGDE